MRVQPWHIIVLVVVLILLFGAKRLPDAARSLGRSMRILKTEVKGMSDDDVERALLAGAKAYLMKDVSPADLVACVRAVHGGGTWVSPTVAASSAPIRS